MLEVLRFCNRFAVNAFDLYIIVRVMSVVFKDRLKDKKALYAALAVNMLVRLPGDYYAPYVWVNVLTNVVLISMLAGCYEAPLPRKAVTAAGIMILLTLSEILIGLVIGIESLSFLERAHNDESIALFLSRILFWAVVTAAMKLMDRDHAYKLPLKVTALETMIFLILGSEFLVLCVRERESIVTESMVLFTAELTFYLMIYLQDCLTQLFASREQAALMEQEKEYYRREAAIIQQKQELQRQFRHDLKNRLQVLQEIAQHGTIPELKQYLAEMEAKHKERQVFASTGNLIIDSIINSKLQDAEEQGIQAHANVALPAAMNINSDDMVVILGNLLDNAIEACQRTGAPGYIRLFMSYEQGCVVLSIKNSFDRIINREQGEFATRKEDKSRHGLGIPSVRHTVGKYNGILEFTSEGTEFCVDAMLYV